MWKFAEEAKLPILGICYGFQEIAHTLGGRVAQAPHREFGHALLRTEALGAGSGGAGDLLAGLGEELTVWMSHGDKIHSIPEGFVRIATSENSEFAAVASVGRPNRMWGLQFHPEVAHTPQGSAILRNFVVGICGAKQDWSMASFVEGESLFAWRSAGGCTTSH